MLKDFLQKGKEGGGREDRGEVGKRKEAKWGMGAVMEDDLSSFNWLSYLANFYSPFTFLCLIPASPLNIFKIFYYYYF